MKYDVLVIGSGIVGSAVAARITELNPNLRLMIAEKERSPGMHQTGHNSGVVHSGIYYTPGSLKARYCREGRERTKFFCEKYNIRYEERGKLLVATNKQEEDNLSGLLERADSNDIPAELLSGVELKAIEPSISGRSAIRIPITAITDYPEITKMLLSQVENSGNDVRFNAPVRSINTHGYAYDVTIGSETISVGKIISCSGLASDRVARMLGINPGVRIIPFRGEYFVLPSQLNQVVHHLIYPIPNPNLPFLGVHLTPMIDGSITVGPNAVLSFAREKYTHFGFNLKDALSSLAYPGLWRIMAKYPRAVLHELKGSISKKVYLRDVQKYCPQIKSRDLAQYRCGNRAQAVKPDGAIVDDFLFKHQGGLTAVLNAPSPAATSALPIADKIVSESL